LEKGKKIYQFTGCINNFIGKDPQLFASTTQSTILTEKIIYAPNLLIATINLLQTIHLHNYFNMHILIRASQDQQDFLLTKSISATTIITWFTNDLIDADAYLDLLFEDEDNIFESIHKKPVIVNAVIKTCTDLPNNFCRINGWNTFLGKEKIEAVTLNNDLKPQLEGILNKLGFKVWFVNDIVGMIAARSIAMIINEAYFGLQDKISGKEQIDIAMKLGTNYPLGPFEWARKIGLKKIELLLQELSKTDIRYKPSDLLINESLN